MTVLPFPEYAPDVTPYSEQESATITNVYPRKDGYGPATSFSAFSQALPAQCRGAFTARNSDGGVTTFAATSTRLWKLNSVDYSWTPVSVPLALTSISNATPAVFSLNSHGLSIGDAFVLSTTGTLPTGLTVGTVYYVISAGFGANSFQASTSVGGSAVNTSSAGSGTHSFTSYYSAVPSADQWQFAQFNNFVIAVQLNAAPQVYDLTSSTAFAALGGSPPQARYIAVVNRFLVLSGLGSSTPYRVQWSGLNATTTWTSGVNSSDFQDLPDGGVVRSIGGGEYGLITQDNCIRRMIYAPGTPYVFQIERLVQDQGIYGPLSLARAADRLFYCGTDGFKELAPGGYPVPIGKERVDRTFLADIDNAQPQLFVAATDPTTTRVYWAYKSLSSTSTTAFDKILVYDYALQRWALITGITGEYVFTAIRPGLSMDNMDSTFASIDAITTVGSLDDISAAISPKLACFDTSHILSFQGSTALEAILETNESEISVLKRIRVRGSRPVTDAATCYVKISARENVQASPSFSTETAVTAKGICPANVSTRLARARLRIPASTSWTFAMGVEPIISQEGQF